MLEYPTVSPNTERVTPRGRGPQLSAFEHLSLSSTLSYREAALASHVRPHMCDPPHATTPTPHCGSRDPAPSRLVRHVRKPRGCDDLGGANDRVHALEVFGLEDERADLGLAVLLRAEADSYLGRGARAAVHRALGGRHAELHGGVAGEAALEGRESVHLVLHGDGRHVNAAHWRLHLGGFFDVGPHGGRLIPRRAVEPRGGLVAQLLHVGRELPLVELDTLCRALAPSIRAERITCDVVAGLLLGAVDDALARVAVFLRDSALVVPILELLRAHAVHLARGQILFGDLGDLLLSVARRAAEVVLARRGDPRIGRTLHVSSPDVDAALRYRCRAKATTHE
mmetsp:Transcript_18750/g.38148  ORF Transcript_18750/g.38148 Transcript_18750/m.38148 type:complete len:340 (-) Transcript_18750:371-1390(-)